jgi:enhancing lycopene biosynthesis protein 2
MKKFAVILAGCGVFDGAEIHEVVMTLYAIEKNGAAWTAFAPDIQQHHVIDHLSKKETAETRNVLIESARLVRGNIVPLSSFNAAEFDALIIPGGFGVAKNLCTFAFDGADCTVNADAEKAILEMHKLNKPIGALCIAPVLLARVLGNVNVTIGDEAATAEALNKMGATHTKTGHGEVIRDAANNVFSTPCYMLDAGLVQIAAGADNIVKAMLGAM